MTTERALRGGFPNPPRLDPGAEQWRTTNLGVVVSLLLAAVGLAMAIYLAAVELWKSSERLQPANQANQIRKRHPSNMPAVSGDCPSF